MAVRQGDPSHTDAREPLRGKEGSAVRVPGARALPKRLLDIVVASLLLLITAPLFVLVALAVKLQDGGPVFYVQERWGRGQKLFRLFKFRTMVSDSDEKYGIRQSAENDARVTRVGRVLRAMGLDELPQLVHILRGDMSFVGPRALAFGEVVVNAEGHQVVYESFPEFAERLTVRPGLTGIATVYLPKDADPVTKFEYDLRYIREATLWTDLKLISLSLLISVLGRWETRAPKV